MTPVAIRGRCRAVHGSGAARLLVVLVLGLALPLLVQALVAKGVAVPEMGLSPQPEQAGPGDRDKGDRAQLQRALRQREHALAQIDRAADAHAEELAAEVARLQALGYTGDLEDLTHVLPLADYRISAGFGLAGPLWESSHTGLDLAAPLGTTLVAIGDGVVSSVGDAGPYGLRTVITLEDGTDLWYAHQLTAVVQPGDVVEVGQPIGLVGSTGNSTGPHLHLEVRPGGGGPVDPMGWLLALELTP